MATMNPIFNEYMKAKKFSPNSVRAYTRNIKSFLEFVNKSDEDIKSSDVKAWAKSISHLSTATVAQKITCVRSYFDVLIEQGVIEHNPADVSKVKAPHVVNKEKHHMTVNQVRDMMNACKSIEMKAIVSLFASSGMRVSELNGITIDEYRAMRANNDNKIYIISKNKKRQPVYFNEQSCGLIDEYLKVRNDRGTGSPYLFLSGYGNKFARNHLSEKLKVIAKDAGISWYEDMAPHQLRAATATILSDEGVPLAQIRDVMRHSSVTTTNRYIKASEINMEANVMNMNF